MQPMSSMYGEYVLERCSLDQELDSCTLIGKRSRDPVLSFSMPIILYNSNVCHLQLHYIFMLRGNVNVPSLSLVSSSPSVLFPDINIPDVIMGGGILYAV